MQPETQQLDPERWAALCARIAPDLDAEAVTSAFNELSAAYAESHRAYHNAEHIAECLARLDEAAEDPSVPMEHPDEIEFALWLHDAIYKTRGSSSESMSAQWATRLLESGGAAPETAARVHAMIMATLHDAAAPFPDAALLVDIDLSILGREEPRFDRYEEDVRTEYRWVPGPLFRSKRKEMLQAFAARPTLYTTQAFRERFELQARINLARSIERL